MVMRRLEGFPTVSSLVDPHRRLVPLVSSSVTVDLASNADSDAVCSCGIFGDIYIEGTCRARNWAGDELLLAVEGEVGEA